LIAISAMISKDVYRRNINPQATDAQVYKLGQRINVVVGTLAFFIAIMNLKTLWFFVGSTAAIAMQWTPLILGALYWKRASTAGAWAGFLVGVGLTALFYYLVACPIPGPGGPAIIGFVANVILFVIVSLATKPIEQTHVAKFQGIFRTA